MLFDNDEIVGDEADMFASGRLNRTTRFLDVLLDFGFNGVDVRDDGTCNFDVIVAGKFGSCSFCNEDFTVSLISMISVCLLESEKKLNIDFFLH